MCTGTSPLPGLSTGAGAEPSAVAVSGEQGQPHSKPPCKAGAQAQPRLSGTEEQEPPGAFGNSAPCLKIGSAAPSDEQTFPALLKMGADFQKCLGIKRRGVLGKQGSGDTCDNEQPISDRVLRCLPRKGASQGVIPTCRRAEPQILSGILGPLKPRAWPRLFESAWNHEML